MLLVLRGVDEEKRHMQGIVMVLITLFVAVGTSTMEHLARRTCYPPGTRLWTADSGTRGERCGTVSPQCLTKETLRARCRTELVL